MQDLPNNNDDIPAPLFDAHAVTRRGRVGVNSDQFLVASLRRSMEIECASAESLDDERIFGDDQAHMLMVADGVGEGIEARRASRAALESVLDRLLNTVPWARDLSVATEAELRQALEDAVATTSFADSGLVPVGSDRDGDARPAATTLAFVRWPTAFIVHAGESRAYRVRKGSIERLTHDVALNAAVRDGDSRFADWIWGALGGDVRVRPQLSVVRLEQDDALVLCTDGLSERLTDRAIEHVVSDRSTAEAACDSLIGAAEAVGGEDDVTVAVARFASAASQGARAASDAKAPRPGPRRARAKEPRPLGRSTQPQRNTGAPKASVHPSSAPANPNTANANRQCDGFAV